MLFKPQKPKVNPPAATHATTVIIGKGATTSAKAKALEKGSRATQSQQMMQGHEDVEAAVSIVLPVLFHCQLNEYEVNEQAKLPAFGQFDIIFVCIPQNTNVLSERWCFRISDVLSATGFCFLVCFMCFSSMLILFNQSLQVPNEDLNEAYIELFLQQSQLAKVTKISWIDTSIVKKSGKELVSSTIAIFVLAKNANMPFGQCEWPGKAHEKFVHNRALIMASTSSVCMTVNFIHLIDFLMNPVIGFGSRMDSGTSMC